ncbi:MAG TPA: PAS domain S-box protein [Desulfuromonadaceae bacterium]|jgi:PAS domain S-box-containing protein
MSLAVVTIFLLCIILAFERAATSRTAALKKEIGERKRIQEALQKSEKHLADIIDFLPDPTFVINVAGEVIAWNRACEEITGIPAKEMLGRGDFEYALPFYGRRRPILIDAVLENDPESILQYAIFEQNGDTVMAEAFIPDFRPGGIYLLCTARRLYNDAGTVIGSIESIHDITIRKLTEKAHLENEKRLQIIFDTSQSGIVQMDAQGTLLFSNQRMAEMFACPLDKLIGTNYPEHVHPSERKQGIGLLSQLVSGAIDHIYTERHYLRRDGSDFWGFFSGKRLEGSDGELKAVVAIITDITENKRIQDIMIQTEKMIMVGGLAAGMAHELNNPLGGILQNTQNIQRRITSGLPTNNKVAEEIGVDFNLVQQYLQRRGINELLKHITAAGTRAADIIANMLVFSRKWTTNLEPTLLPQIIDRALELANCDYDLKKQYDFRNIQIVREYQDLPPIVMNSLEIEQVILNIVKNAAQAMSDKTLTLFPRITLRTRYTDQYALIEVEDNGPGIPENVADRIFDPFFTTKEIGVGTGLGLSVAYALVVNNHRGIIKVDSQTGRGARFTISLPLTPQVSE